MTSKKRRRTRTRERQCATTEDEAPSTDTPLTLCPPSSPAPAADQLSRVAGDNVIARDRASRPTQRSPLPVLCAISVSAALR